nr:PREDICTED: pyroglutamylated RFamide peptide receptor-like [Latimeria chalumnae]|eukprot:XP_014343467.1 PREDICTED: pyroglutamylated RFamide peptide receptor-like [Latimeria chalumnae]
MVPFIQITAVSTGIFTMMCIAIERFQGILYPLQLQNSYTVGKAIKMLVAVWLSAMAIASPMWYAQKVEVIHDFLYNTYYTCCREDWPLPQYRQAYTTIILLLVFLIPLVTMAFLYGKVVHELWVKQRVHDAMFQALPGSEIKKITRESEHNLRVKAEKQEEADLNRHLQNIICAWTSAIYFKQR